MCPPRRDLDVVTAVDHDAFLFEYAVGVKDRLTVDRNELERRAELAGRLGLAQVDRVFERTDRAIEGVESLLAVLGGDPDPHPDPDPAPADPADPAPADGGGEATAAAEEAQP